MFESFQCCGLLKPDLNLCQTCEYENMLIILLTRIINHLNCFNFHLTVQSEPLQKVSSDFSISSVKLHHVRSSLLLHHGPQSAQAVQELSRSCIMWDDDADDDATCCTFTWVQLKWWRTGQGPSIGSSLCGVEWWRCHSPSRGKEAYHKVRYHAEAAGQGEPCQYFVLAGQVIWWWVHFSFDGRWAAGFALCIDSLAAHLQPPGLVFLAPSLSCKSFCLFWHMLSCCFGQHATYGSKVQHQIKSFLLTSIPLRRKTNI